MVLLFGPPHGFQQRPLARYVPPAGRDFGGSLHTRSLGGLVEQVVGRGAAFRRRAAFSRWRPAGDKRFRATALAPVRSAGRTRDPPLRLFEADARPLGEHLEGLAELDAFDLHDEREDVAADVTDPALERLPFGIDLEAGPGVVVPGAKGHVVAALTAQGKMLADQLDDIGRLLDALFGVERTARHP